MFSLSSSDRYLLYRGDCDMRRGAYSLNGLVRNELGRNPLSGDVFVFLNRRRTCIKLLRWESGGFVLFVKHLEKGTYTRPVGTRNDGALSWAELVLMVEGILVLFGYFAIYLTTPNDLNWHLSASLDRLFHHLFPSCIYLFLFRLSSAPNSRQMLGESNSLSN